MLDAVVSELEMPGIAHMAGTPRRERLDIRNRLIILTALSRIRLRNQG
jgi:hypothetical protein